MRRHAFLALLAATAAIAAPIAADDRPFPSPATFTTLQVTPLAIEGLTGDELGNLYTTGRAAPPERCPVWQIGPNGGLIVVGTIGNAAPGCNPSGIRRDRDGNFFIADANQGGVIWKLRAADMNPAAPFATGRSKYRDWAIANAVAAKFLDLRRAAKTNERTFSPKGRSKFSSL